MNVRIIDDGWQDLRSVDVIGVIVGPVGTVLLTHVLWASLAKQVDPGKAVTSPAERLDFLRVRTSLSALRVTLWLEGLSLGYRSDVAARRAGASRWRVRTHNAVRLILGIVILLLQVARQPGRAFSGGRALG
jgi:hypothetical protein